MDSIIDELEELVTLIWKLSSTIGLLRSDLNDLVVGPDEKHKSYKKNQMQGVCSVCEDMAEKVDSMTGDVLDKLLKLRMEVAA